MKIVFLTTLNLASNPRLYKEIMLALGLGYEAEVICFEFRNWSYEYNLQLLKNIAGAKVHVIAANKKPFLPWLKSVVSEKMFRKTDQFLPLSDGALSQAISRRSGLLLRNAANITGKVDWVIAHNPGAFYPAFWLAEKKQSRLGIDLEDFHPGETNDTRANNRMKRLLKRVLPHADYLTAASPLIMEESLKLADPDCPKKIILNYFPKDEFEVPQMVTDDAFQLVWFSQHISFDRGLEQIIPIVESRKDVELHLFGNCDPQFFEEWLADRKHIFVHQSLPQKELHNTLSAFDAGLALEDTESNFNRTLCITNKILAYFQAGLYIIASETPAQAGFLKLHSHAGIILTSGHKNFADKFSAIISSKDSIRRTKAERYRNAMQHNWESESEKIAKLWLSPRSVARYGR